MFGRKKGGEKKAPKVKKDRKAKKTTEKKTIDRTRKGQGKRAPQMIGKQAAAIKEPQQRAKTDSCSIVPLKISKQTVKKNTVTPGQVAKEWSNKK